MTTDVHLGRTVADGDWARAGFDVAALAFGGAAALAWRWSVRRASHRRLPSSKAAYEGSAS
jgi:hypothetical protein